MQTNIGTKIRNLRKQKGLSQEQVADSLNISQSAYARIEKGESNSWATNMDRICNFFEIHPEELFKQERVVINNLETNNGVGYAEVVNQLSEKLLEQFEARLEEKENTIKELKERLKKYE